MHVHQAQVPWDAVQSALEVIVLVSGAEVADDGCLGREFARELIERWVRLAGGFESVKSRGTRLVVGGHAIRCSLIVVGSEKSGVEVQDCVDCTAEVAL